MQLTEPGSAPRPDGEVRLVALSARPTLPPRVRSLLEGVLALAGGLLERSLALTLNEHEQQLFKLAEKAHSSNEQHAVFESLREVKRGRADVAPRFMLFLESALAQLDGKPEAAASAPPRRFQELALVETRDLEEHIALQEISAKAEIRHSQALYALGHRFGVMAGAPALDAERLPLGPQQICAALRYATACLGIALEHRLLLYRQFDRVALAEAGALFSAVNDYLIEKRILPHLQLAPGRGSVATPPQSPANAANTPPPAGARPAPPRGASGSRTAQPEDTRDSELFHTLRELLAGRRQHLAPVPAAAGTLSSYVATGEDLQAVLGSLQARPAAPMILGGRVVQRNIAHLRQDLLNQLRQFTPDGRPPRLTEVDADTLDLVGMLFDFIAKDVRPTGATQSLLTKLQVPVLRVALRDKSFFTRRGHPARQLLNAIAETGQYWIDETEGEADRVLVEKMQLVVDRVSNEFDGRDELFDELLTDLSRHMGTLARKAEVSERRHVDAAKGRERLDIARERATQAVAARLQDKKVNRLVRSLLEQAWTDVLALTILRQGEESEVYRRRLGVVEQLVAGQETGSPALRHDIEQGLGQVGFHAEEVQEMLQQILGGGPPRDDSSATRTELALKLKSKTRLGEEPAAEAPPVASAIGGPAAGAAEAAAETAPLSAEERQMLERLKTLPYGTWFEFVLNQQGDTVRRKLSWFSTLTGRCLFVNQRGARTEERSMQQLARDLVRKQVRIVSEERESLIDRAWHAIVGTLRNFAGKPPAAQTDAG
ncbi:DUF1631 domain-containing protein [Tahibacter harae]|uniref:DUF1631 domain-containing protein n=1 Tax=Tahibacter harae TaxID=2963937 RepID=A0ABT1QR27_9GAMM|nr:DUF1631 domain-containing protein [Tahibacter harae]MCQ4164727.1 DUF1631 domain-containing protein [Tahibacter harae]